MVESFALKVGRWCSFGFAAGCEAVAVPRHTRAFLPLGYAPGAGLWPNKIQGQSPHEGRSPGNNLPGFGGA